MEWTRLPGEEVEAVMAIMLCTKHPTAHRVRPSQGDGGVDVFVPGPVSVSGGGRNGDAARRVLRRGVVDREQAMGAMRGLRT